MPLINFEEVDSYEDHVQEAITEKRKYKMMEDNRLKQQLLRWNSMDDKVKESPNKPEFILKKTTSNKPWLKLA